MIYLLVLLFRFYFEMTGGMFKNKTEVLQEKAKAREETGSSLLLQWTSE